MVMKAKSDEPIKPLRDVSEYTTWSVPSLELGEAPSFLQPVEEDEEEEELSEEAKLELEAEELERLKEQAKQQGFEQGKQEGLAAASSEIEMLKESLSNMILQLSDPVKLCREKTQQQLMQLSFAVARQIVRRELKQDPTQIIAIIREALKLLPVGSQNITIGLHPEDEAAVSKALSIDKDNSSPNWQIKSDPSLERGSCLVNTDNSTIDASIDKQIAVLFSRIVGGQRAGESDAN